MSRIFDVIKYKKYNSKKIIGYAKKKFVFSF